MMKRDSKPLMKKPLYGKLVLISVMLGITMFLFSSRSIDYLSPSLQAQTSSVSSDDVLKTQKLPAVDSVQGAETDHLHASTKGSASSPSSEHNNEAKPKCDLFKGDWVPNPSGPAYNNFTCQTIDAHQNCMANGRPDTGYLYWRWKPKDCELPKFNPQRFLELMRNKHFGIIGDSLSRNQLQSMLCMLSQVEPLKEIYHDAEYIKNTWFVPSYNFNITRIFSPFLVKSELIRDNNGVPTGEINLQVDKLDDNWTKHYHDFDYVMFSGGQWFLKTAMYYENNAVIGCHHCLDRESTYIGFDEAFRKALNLVCEFVAASSHRPRILLRTIAPAHFEGGDWSEGGACRRKVPSKENELDMTDVEKALYEIQLQGFDKAIGKVSGNRVEMKLFDTTKMSLLRPDGHPGVHRENQSKDKNGKVQSDCLHWCLPGPIDSWNDLLLESLMRS